MSHCSRTLPSPWHPIQLTPFPKKASNIYRITFLAFQTLWVPCASLQQCKASLWGTTGQQDLEVAMKKIRFRSLWIKTHCAVRPFFLGSFVALPTLVQSLSSHASGQGGLNSSIPNTESQRCLTSSWKYQQKISLWPKQAWYSSPPNILGQMLLQRNDKQLPGLQNPSPTEGTLLLLLACC